MAEKVQYDRSRFPIQPAKGLCRGCHQPLPKRKRSWCSNECYQRYDPNRVRFHCWERDKGVCSECGVDTERMSKRAKSMMDFYGWTSQMHPRFWEGGNFTKKFLRERHDRATKIFVRWKPKLQQAIDNRRRRMFAHGWPSYSCRDWWEMDHVVPFSEGGITVLENVRTLCVPCHKKRTKHWHKARKPPKDVAQMALL